MEHKTIAVSMVIKEEEEIPRSIFQDRENPLDNKSDAQLVSKYTSSVCLQSLYKL